MAPSESQRIRIRILGAVQGVGFRPFVYRLATELELRGWVANSPEGVLIEGEGPAGALEALRLRVEREKPPLSSIRSLEAVWLDPVGHLGFEVRESGVDGTRSAFVMPDIATCGDCLRELFDPADRRYRYPFINCTNCGPRYSIAESIPWDRERTSMRRFAMCAECLGEYRNPSDRRFHAEPNACTVCGPRLEALDPLGIRIAEGDAALLAAAERVRAGQVLALKGIGGFHLLVDARGDGAVALLRARKRREEKPFALLYPDLERVRRACEVSPIEEALLRSPEAPIVLLRARGAGDPELDPASRPSEGVAPGNPNLGVLLPYSPIHHLLLRELGFPVVATSGNLSDEPIATSTEEALVRLRGIADVYLVHDRPIVRAVDDSIARVVAGRELVLRRSRGYAPLPLVVPDVGAPILGVGAHLKNTVALAVGSNVFLSQHVGDLDTPEALDAFHAVVEGLEDLFGVRPASVACDLHPDYASSTEARRLEIPLERVQHHHAHVAACMVECELEGRVLGVSWDGTGYGPDGSVWGGEFLLATAADFERFAHLAPFPLPGGDKAAREPRRSALGLLWRLLGPAVFAREDLAPMAAFDSSERKTLASMLEGRVNCPETSSAGRLFDAVASLVGLRQRARFEGQAAMQLEHALARDPEGEAYPVRVERRGDGQAALVHWDAMVSEIIREFRSGTAPARVSARFHNTLVDAIVRVAEAAGEERVVLTGGCFQNRYLVESALGRLQSRGFRPYRHQRVPPNDGGVALGQVAVASARLRRTESGGGGLAKPS